MAKKVLLIGWDAADWQHINPLLEQGLMPGLESLIDRGVMGNLATLHPVLSPMLWNSIATGKTADKHGVLGFTEPLPSGKGVRPFASTSRKVKALWNICHQNNLTSNVVGWWASHPAEPIRGCVVSNLFNGLAHKRGGELRLAPGTFHPQEKSEDWAELKIHPHEITGMDIVPFIPRAKEIDQAADPRLATARKLLADCASIQSIATHLIENEPWDLTAVYFDSIDHFCHAFMAYHPPKMKNVKSEDFEIFKDVIKGAYQFHDMILQRLMFLAGDDTTIVLCSDHGFQSGALRPQVTPAEPAGPAAWHRDLGIIVMAGPGIKKDERIYGANIIDVTPTILYQLGLPVGEDMDGRVLIDAFIEPTAPEQISSWEDVEGACGQNVPVDMNDGSENITDSQSQELVKQFVALGYIEDPGDDLEKAARNCQLELDYNLARVYLSTNRYDHALNVLVDLVCRMPWEDRYWKNLAQCYFELGYYRQSQEIMASLYRDTEKPPVFSQVFVARTHFKLGETEQGHQQLNAAMARNPKQPMVYVMAGQLLLRNGQWEGAEKMFSLAVEIDADNPHARVGLAEVFLQMQRNEEAVDAALAALVILYRLERAHWILGIACERIQHWGRAKQAFEMLLKFKATRYEVAAHRRLKRICRQLGMNSEADLHSQMAREISRRQRPQRKSILSRREARVDLPSIPSARDRMETHILERPRQQAGAVATQSPGSSGRTLTIVSGLPRSGTSLMMQMLSAGGLPSKTDGQRIADADNPQGYLEWEEVKQLPKQPSLLDDESLDDFAIKIISMLLGSLPPKHHYQVIFMTRPVQEVVASQQKMIERRGTGGSGSTDVEMAQQLEDHRQRAINWLKSKSFIELLQVDYPALILDSAGQAERVATFLGPRKLPNPEAMTSVIDPDLYRQKQP